MDIVKSSFVIVFCSALAACSSGGGSDAITSPSQAASQGGSTGGANGGNEGSPKYEKLNSSADKTSTIGGVGLHLVADPTKGGMVKLSGSLKHDTGNATLSDGIYTLKDPDGFKGQNGLTDGTATVRAIDGLGAYEYVQLIEMNHKGNSDVPATFGAAGVITGASDIPKSGKATYTGQSGVRYQVHGSDFIEANGRATVTADFAANEVDVKIDRIGGLSALDEVRVNNMTIQGNGFEGGTVQTLQNGTENTTAALGNVSVNESAGAFFGGVESGAPAEVGGVVLGGGSKASVSAIYAAD